MDSSCLMVASSPGDNFESRERYITRSSENFSRGTEKSLLKRSAGFDGTMYFPAEWCKRPAFKMCLRRGSFKQGRVRKLLINAVDVRDRIVTHCSKSLDLDTFSPYWSLMLSWRKLQGILRDPGECKDTSQTNQR